MTGHQPHPGTGRNMMGHVVDKVEIASVLRGIGVREVQTVDPLNLSASVEAIRALSSQKGVRAVIFKSPCVALSRPQGRCAVDPAKCVSCRKCVREIGCPALIAAEGRVTIDPNLCTGCGLCAQICPTGAIGGGQHE